MPRSSDLNGVVCACVTPVTNEYKIDVERLAKHAEAMLAAGCGFVSLFGTTGEGASFSSREKCAALEALRNQGADMSRHIPAVMAASVDEAAMMLDRIDQLGCRAALIIPPYYYKAADNAAVVDFYEAALRCAGSPDLQVILYNFPFFSGVTFDPALVQAMIDRLGSQIVGIKDSTGDLDAGKRLISEFPNLAIFTGDDRILPAMVEAGGAGMIGGMINPYPDDALKLYKGPVTDEMAAVAKRRIEAVDVNGGLSVLKAMLAMKLGDPDWARCAPPLRAASEETLAAVADAIAPDRIGH
ncbi:dihydrodipicolinate synthase family protein [Qingshengfaniella alkalisoli]|uniref:Dihydrodipicolinate synthase family protein n=1 Tax=Qingshengfaniella alkalisoli TaxID=2599296 RepID=A0A5B8IZV2_9RHOB|nr:dihydrodipicolinate synthase family protein [Qingshengfaniella alkalisoli]QDY71083.1 dihydrodipicolinate synthase family protein [Qingshengfaniella alkalisoli]